MKDFLTRDYPEKDIVYVEGHPIPPAMPVRPLTALKGAFGLMANKEDTSQVYEVTNALSGGVHIQKFKQFIATDYGRKVIETPIRIEDVLSDRDRLKAMPHGTVGRHFFEFVHKENLSEDALLDATKTTGIDYLNPGRFEAFCRQIIHFKVTHDLWHVLTGYGRDAIGEIALLEFYLGQWYDRGIRLIVSFGALSARKDMPASKIRQILREARHNSQDARWIMGFDVESLLTRPLKEVRQDLGIKPPKIYQALDDEIKFGLLQPKAAVTTAAE